MSSFPGKYSSSSSKARVFSTPPYSLVWDHHGPARVTHSRENSRQHSWYPFYWDATPLPPRWLAPHAPYSSSLLASSLPQEDLIIVDAMCLCIALDIVIGVVFHLEYPSAFDWLDSFLGVNQVPSLIFGQCFHFFLHYRFPLGNVWCLHVAFWLTDFSRSQSKEKTNPRQLTRIKVMIWMSQIRRTSNEWDHKLKRIACRSLQIDIVTP